jgi:hypothetical protein
LEEVEEVDAIQPLPSETEQMVEVAVEVLSITEQVRAVQQRPDRGMPAVQVMKPTIQQAEEVVPGASDRTPLQMQEMEVPE